MQTDCQASRRLPIDTRRRKCLPQAGPTGAAQAAIGRGTTAMRPEVRLARRIVDALPAGARYRANRRKRRQLRSLAARPDPPRGFPGQPPRRPFPVLMSAVRAARRQGSAACARPTPAFFCCRVRPPCFVTHGFGTTSSPTSTSASVRTVCARSSSAAWCATATPPSATLAPRPWRKRARKPAGCS